MTGICDKLYNCVIGEIGVTNDAGKPYPSSGFTSCFVMAHEIGHNLGMSHDFHGSDANNLRVHNGQRCNGFMAYNNPPNVWSPCSVADFKAHYTNYMNSWCMQGID